jgi:hypothetical protein
MNNIGTRSDITKPTKLYARVRMHQAHMSSLTVENKETHAYKWTIETALGTFTGTCSSINDLNEEITLLTNNSKIIKKNITPITQMDENSNDKRYTWLVTTHSGQVTGVSISLEDAREVINSFGKDSRNYISHK